MLRKTTLTLMFVSLSICLCLMSNTYSRYVSDTKGNIDVLFAKWQILVNDDDITTKSNSTINIVPVIEENENVADSVVAPTSKGHFDINIDPTNVELSFNYLISLEIDNENVPDLIIAKYAIIPNSTSGSSPDIIDLNGSVIENTLIFDKSIESFQFEPFTIRIYFEWYDGEEKVMSNEEQAEIGGSNETFSINAQISFQQEV